MTAKTITTPLLFRELELDRVDERSRSVVVSFSSEEPYERFFGVEILDHDPGSVRLDRLRRAGIALFNHDRDQPVGTLSDVRLDGKRGRAAIKFFSDEDGQRVFSKVKEGLRGVSVGYRVHEMRLEKQSDDGADVYRATDWEPFEVSIVSVPADATVGVGRNDEIYEVRIMTTESGREGGTSRRAKSGHHAGVEAERQRVAEIRAVTRAFPDHEEIQRLAEKAIDEGVAFDKFNREALELLGHRTYEPALVTSADIAGLEDRDRKRFSITRLVRGLAASVAPGFVDARTSKQWAKEAGLEFEICAAYSKRVGRDPHDERALVVPTDLLYGARLLDIATEGADVRQTDVLGEQLIEALRARVVVIQAGAELLPGLVGNVLIPRQSGVGTITWLAESGSAGDTTQTFDNVPLEPHTMSARSDISRRMLLQSSFAMDGFVERDLLRGMVVELDRVCIEGAPDVTATALEPRGIINTSGIGSVAIATHGGAPTRAHLVDLVTEVARDNALVGTPWFLMNSLTIGFFMKQLVDSGSGQFTMMTRDNAIGFPVGESQNVPTDLAKGSGTNLSAIIFGDFASMVLGLWSGQDLLVDPYTQGATGALRLVAFQDVDVAVRRPQSFAAIVDANLS